MIAHGFVLAQSDSTDAQGEVLSGQIVIEKQKNIILPQADKIYRKAQAVPEDNQPIAIPFQVQEPSLAWPDYKTDIPFQMNNDSYPVESYQNYIKAGYGNYGSPLVAAGLFRAFGDFDTRALLFFEHFSSGPVHADQSGNTLGNIKLSSNYHKEGLLVSPTVSYQNFRYHFYGNTNRENTGFTVSNAEEVSLHDFAFTTNIGIEKENVSYGIEPIIHYTNQISLEEEGINKEMAVGVNGNFLYKLDENFSTGFELEGKTSKYSGGLKTERSLLNLNPWITYQIDNWTLTGGFNLSSGIVAKKTKTGLYPELKASYQISDKWTSHAFLSGGQSWNGLKELLDQNQWMDDSLVMVNTINNYQVGGGITGYPTDNLRFKASVVHSNSDGIPFHVPSASDSAKYTLTYDTDAVNTTTFSVDASYMPTTTSTYGLKLTLNGYSLSSLDKPWHKPSYILKASTSHNLNEKVILSAYFTSMGGMKAPTQSDFGYADLPAFLDIGITSKYLINPRTSVFIHVNNLLNDEYERYLGYPTRGLTFKIGARYRF